MPQDPWSPLQEGGCGGRGGGDGTSPRYIFPYILLWYLAISLTRFPNQEGSYTISQSAGTACGSRWFPQLPPVGSPRYDIMIWYHDMISWYHIMISYHDMILYHSMRAWYHIMVSYHDIISWYHDMISWYDIMISYHDISCGRGNSAVTSHGFCEGNRQLLDFVRYNILLGSTLC